MAQDSIAYGESLLSDIRQRNDKLRSRQRKQARKDEWKTLAVDIGMNVANDIFATRRNELLNNEDNLRQKMEITSANTFATDFSNQMSEANKYAGGEKAYWKNDFNTVVNNELGKKFLPNQRNELQYQKLLVATVNKNFESYYNEVKKKQEATKKFLYKGTAENYNLNMNKITGEGTAKNAVARTISKLTGNLDLDVYESRNEELQKASKEYQTTYVDTFAKTRDEMLATAVAELSENAAGVPAPKLSGAAYTLKVTDLAGNQTEERRQDVVVSRLDKNNNIIQHTMVMGVGANGTYQPITAASQNKEADLNQIAAALSANQVTRGKLEYTDLSGGLLARLGDIWAKQISLETKGKIAPNDIGYNDFLEPRRSAFVRKIIASGIQARNEGWGTEKTGQLVYAQAIEDKLSGEEDAGGVRNIGALNVFDTMFALNKLTTKANDTGVINGKSGISKLAKDVNSMYDGLEAMSAGNRAKLFDRLSKPNDEGGVNYFEGNIDSSGDFENYLNAFENIFKNQTIYNKDRYESVNEMLVASMLDLQEAQVKEQEKNKSIEERKQERMKALQKTLNNARTLRI
jgi:hypothetical protein